MSPSRILRGVALVRTDVSEERSLLQLLVLLLTLFQVRWLFFNLMMETIRYSATLKKFLRSVHRLIVTANGVPRTPILVTLMMEALSSSETLVLTRATHGVTSKKTLFFIHRLFIGSNKSSGQRTINRQFIDKMNRAMEVAGLG
jgi:hypothetical protein